MKINYAAVLIFVVAIAGCAGKPSYSNSAATSEAAPVQATSTTATEISTTTSAMIQQTSVQTLGLFLAQGKNWNSDPDADGVEVTIQPKDVNDDMVRAAGAISAKLWYSDLDSAFSNVKGDFIQEWTNIRVSRDNYDFLGAEVRLEYKPEVKQSILSHRKYQMGWLEIILTTPDGKSFTAKYDSVLLAGYN